MNDLSFVATRRRFNVDDYYRMAEAGILHPDERTELIDGDVVVMAPITQVHAGSVNRFNQALVLAFAGRAILSVQNPVRLDDLSEPQPHFAILRRRDDFYATGERASAADVLLLIEVADSSLRFDRTVKLPLYARSGIPEVWVVDLKRRVVDVHRGLRDGRFQDSTTVRVGGALVPERMPDVRISWAQVFG